MSDVPESTPSAAQHPAAVLWDLDGTLVDTEPLWMAAEHDIAARHGATWTATDAMTLVGNDLTESGRYIKSRMGLSESVEEIVDELVTVISRRMSEPIEWRPGAVELLREMRQAGVPIALVTMSYRAIVEPLLPQLPDGVFDVIVPGDEVRAGKPHPEPYLTAARELGVDARHCVAIEDSPTGAASAEAAGCHVIVVPNHVAVDSSPDRTIVSSLADVDVETVRAIAGQALSRR